MRRRRIPIIAPPRGFFALCLLDGCGPPVAAVVESQITHYHFLVGQ